MKKTRICFLYLTLIFITSTTYGDNNFDVPPGYSGWQDLYVHNTGKKKMIEMVHCNNKSCNNQIGDGGEDEPIFAMSQQGNFKHLPDWDVEEVTKLSVSQNNLQLTGYNPNNDYHSTVQAEDSKFAFFQNSKSYDGGGITKIMSSFNYNFDKGLYSDENSIYPWRGDFNHLLVSLKVAVPYLLGRENGQNNFDSENTKSSGTIVLDIIYDDGNESSPKPFFYLKPQFFGTGGGIGPTDLIQVDEEQNGQNGEFGNSGIIMARAFFKPDSKFIKVTDHSHEFMSGQFGLKVFQATINRRNLRNIALEINKNSVFQSYGMTEFPTDWKLLKNYRIRSIKISQETNLDLKGSGGGEPWDFESALKVEGLKLQKAIKND